MKGSLVAGLADELRFTVPASKTVPALYPESVEFRQMPEVFATGYLVGLLEWTCIRAINPCLDWPTQQTVGTHERFIIDRARFASKVGQKKP